MPAVHSLTQKKHGSRSLYLQLLFVTLAFTLMVVSTGIFVNNMLMNYLEREAENILTQTRIRIENELQEPRTLMIPIVNDVRDIIVGGGGAGDVLEYFDDIYADLLKKEGGFVFDGVRGYFEALGNVYISAPQWALPDNFNATERPWYKAAVEANGKITLTPMYMNLRAGIYVIDFSCRIFDDSGVPLGVASVSLQFSNITNFVADMRLVEGGYGFLANENFELVAHHEADLITRHMNELGSGSRRIVEMMEQGAGFIKVEGNNYQDKNSIIYCARIDNGWYLGIMTPRDVYYKDLRTLITFLGVMGFVLMLVVDIILVHIDNTRNRLDEAFREQHVQLAKRLEQQSLMTYISQSFLSTEDTDTLIRKALGMAGEFMDIDQILMYVAADGGSSFICKNEWIKPKSELPTRIDNVLAINQTILDTAKKLKERKLFHVTSDDPNVRKTLEPYRVTFFTYILTCVFLGDDLYAVIDFSKSGDDSRWDQDDINMASFVTNILTGALNKRSAELQLIEAKESAEQSNHAKGIFLANMSHEIRTPMNAILGISEIQLQDKTLSPDTEEAFKQIYDSGHMLINIINDILDFSKIEAGKMEIVPAKYDVPSLIHDTVQLNRLRYESKTIEFKLDVDANTPLELYGDELRIKQILNNLLSNAFKYTDKGEIKLSVHAEQGNDNETVTLVLRVSDTGQGMREDQISRLFDEYSRFNMQTNRGISGTGLGMNIAKRLIVMMGGDILVESEVGKGTIFTVCLPQRNIGPAVCGEELVENLRGLRFHSTPISRKARIVHEYMPYGSVMVVDDVASNLYVAKGLMTPYGLRIETVSSGIEAIEKIKNGGVYDIVFMDHMMPVMDGIEAAKIIRGIGYTNPIVALTANAVVGQSEVFMANGFDGFISKPIDSRELDAVLDRFIHDKQPPEVIEAARLEKRKRQTGNSPGPDKNKKAMFEIEKYFVLDAENAIAVIEEAYAKLPGDSVENYITAVHGMKSALANIGETELSAAALRLEQAGNEKNFALVMEETPLFISGLKSLYDKYKHVNDDDVNELSGDHIVYLRDKFLDIKLACEKSDIKTAKNALDNLKRKTWPRYVNGILDEISAHLSRDAFGKAAGVAENAAKM